MLLFALGCIRFFMAFHVDHDGETMDQCGLTTVGPDPIFDLVRPAPSHYRARSREVRRLPDCRLPSSSLPNGRDLQALPSSCPVEGFATVGSHLGTSLYESSDALLLDPWARPHHRGAAIRRSASAVSLIPAVTGDAR